MKPFQYNPDLNICFFDTHSCEEDIDLVYYSKDEKVIDFNDYDWLITDKLRYNINIYIIVKAYYDC